MTLSLLCVTIARTQQAPQIDKVSLKVSPAIQDPNAHIFNVNKGHKEHRFDYRRLKLTNETRQPVLFEHMTELHLTRSKYIVTSLVRFSDYHKSFNTLENFIQALIDEITNLENIRRSQEVSFKDVIKVHEDEVIGLLNTTKGQRLHFEKIIDHLEPEIEKSEKKRRRVKRGLIHKVFDFLLWGCR